LRTASRSPQPLAVIVNSTGPSSGRRAASGTDNAADFLPLFVVPVQLWLPKVNVTVALAAGALDEQLAVARIRRRQRERR
jgi:hypothetical protein